ncbi:hypothetical protein FPV67DRAFT_1456467 [Lyophyllum atratum]|nr:hypothetical protein FPV67DRAFT_1456467 [Lyophyllum atratum]
MVAILNLVISTVISTAFLTKLRHPVIDRYRADFRSWKVVRCIELLDSMTPSSYPAFPYRLGISVAGRTEDGAIINIPVDVPKVRRPIFLNPFICPASSEPPGATKVHEHPWFYPSHLFCLASQLPTSFHIQSADFGFSIAGKDTFTTLVDIYRGYLRWQTWLSEIKISLVSSFIFALSSSFVCYSIQSGFGSSIVSGRTRTARPNTPPNEAVPAPEEPFLPYADRQMEDVERELYYIPSRSHTSASGSNARDRSRLSRCGDCKTIYREIDDFGRPSGSRPSASGSGSRNLDEPEDNRTNGAHAGRSAAAPSNMDSAQERALDTDDDVSPGSSMLAAHSNSIDEVTTAPANEDDVFGALLAVTAGPSSLTVPVASELSALGYCSAAPPQVTIDSEAPPLGRGFVKHARHKQEIDIFDLPSRSHTSAAGSSSRELSDEPGIGLTDHARTGRSAAAPPRMDSAEAQASNLHHDVSPELSLLVASRLICNHSRGCFERDSALGGDVFRIPLASIAGPSSVTAPGAFPLSALGYCPATHPRVTIDSEAPPLGGKFVKHEGVEETIGINHAPTIAHNHPAQKMTDVADAEQEDALGALEDAVELADDEIGLGVEEEDVQMVGDGLEAVQVPAIVVELEAEGCAERTLPITSRHTGALAFSPLFTSSLTFDDLGALGPRVVAKNVKCDCDRVGLVVNSD